MEKEKWSEEMQFEVRKQLEKKEDMRIKESSKVELPKLVIPKFEKTLPWTGFGSGNLLR